jgi:hypothetical protein
MASSRHAITKLKAILLIDLIIVGLAAGGYCYIQAFLRTVVPPPAGPKPAEFVLGNLTITPAEAEVNQPIIVKVDVANVGEEPGICVLSLTINNVVEETRTVQLSGGNSTTVEFTVIKDVVGMYYVKIGGMYYVKIGDLTGTFKIVAHSPAPQPRPAAFTIYGLTITPL